MDGNSSRPIFRDAAVKNYVASKEKDVLPRFLKPPLFGLLWLIFGGLVIGLAAVGQIPIPAYMQGTVLSLENRGASQADILLLLPQQTKTSLQAGQTVELVFQDNSKLAGSLVASETAPVKVQERARQLHLTNLQAKVLLEIKLASEQPARWSESGQSVAVQAKIGTYKVSDLLPFMSWLK